MWSIGASVWFWDHATGRLWKRRARLRSADEQATKLAITGSTAIIGVTGDPGLRLRSYQYLRARVTVWNLPKAKSERWQLVRRLRPGQRIVLPQES